MPIPPVHRSDRCAVEGHGRLRYAISHRNQYWRSHERVRTDGEHRDQERSGRAVHADRTGERQSYARDGERLPAVRRAGRSTESNKDRVLRSLRERSSLRGAPTNRAFQKVHRNRSAVPGHSRAYRLPPYGALIMELDVSQISNIERYKLMIGLVYPRPIALVSTWSPNGVANCAPFSYFNAMCEEPMLVVLSFNARSDGKTKHSLANLLRTGEFVVNLVDEGVA